MYITQSLHTHIDEYFQSSIFETSTPAPAHVVGSLCVSCRDQGKVVVMGDQLMLRRLLLLGRFLSDIIIQKSLPIHLYPSSSLSFHDLCARLTFSLRLLFASFGQLVAPEIASPWILQHFIPGRVIVPIVAAQSNREESSNVRGITSQSGTAEHSNWVSCRIRRGSLVY